MLNKLKKFWNKYGFEIVLGIAVVFILLLSLFRIGKKGTWSKGFRNGFVIPKTPGRRPPQESKGELECRRVLEKMFNKPFPKSRPNFLRNPVTSYNTDNNLELDCYNEELKIAVEYNGIQHYKYIPFFHKNKEAFQNQKYRDYMKREICEKNGIKLIEVPNTVKIENIESYLREKLKMK
jgi:hypothetical protein